MRAEVVEARTRTVAATIDAVGADAVGFAAGDRVLFLLPGVDALPGEGSLSVVDVSRLIGVPRGVPLDRAAVLFVPGVMARDLVKGSSMVGRGHTVVVLGTETLAGALAAAWATHLGAHVLDPEEARTGARVDAVLDARDIARIGKRRAGGRLAQDAADVLQAVRAGVFDDIDTTRPTPRSVAA